VTTLIAVSSVTKRFRISHHRPTSLRERFIRKQLFRDKITELWALRNIDFTVRQGEVFGILGSNGSGKSTLLRLLAGVMEPTSGTISVRGRVGALLDLAAGFHPELTGLENVELNATLLGMNPKEIAHKRTEIIDFSGIEDFIDTPVKYYSSGMLMRLGFSISIHLDPDILLVDEVLAVGDENYQRRCLDRIDQLRDSGKSVLLVSHDMQQIRQMCSRAIWLNEGIIKHAGDAEEVVQAYLSFADHTDTEIDGPEHGGRWGTREIEITDVALLGSAESARVFQCGDTWTVRIRYTAHSVIKDPVFGLGIHRSDGLHITGPNTRTARFSAGTVEGPGFVEYTVSDLALLPGVYNLSVAVYDAAIRHPYDHHDRLHRFRVGKGNTLEREGIVTFNGVWNHGVGNGVD